MGNLRGGGFMGVGNRKIVTGLSRGLLSENLHCISHCMFST